MGIFVFCILFVFLQNSVNCGGGGGGQIVNWFQNLASNINKAINSIINSINNVINDANQKLSQAGTKLNQILDRGNQTSFFK
jgi:hypothetical protein